MLAFLALDFRNPKRVALVALPLVVGLLGLVAVMALWRLELNLFNLVVLPSIIGIGVDNAIHIYHRYRREGRGSVMLVVRYTGAAALLASLTTAVGFGSSMIAHSPGLRSLGSLAVIGIASTFASAVLFFPSVLSLLERRLKKG
jgi:predicted RND superfamily exporter protein